MKSASLVVCLLVLTSVHVSQALATPPPEPPQGTFNAMKLAGVHKVANLLIKEVYSYETIQQDATQAWLNTPMTVSVSNNDLEIFEAGSSVTDPYDGLNASMPNINGGKTPVSIGPKMKGYSLAYTTADGVFYKQLISDGTTSQDHIWYVSAAISMAADGSVSIRKFSEDCPYNAAMICGPIGPNDQYSSSKLWTALLK